MGFTTHQSPLRFKIRSLMATDPSAASLAVEEWLIDIANLRGARVVNRPGAADETANPDRDAFSDEELVVACCQPNAADQPQLLRPAAQLVSRNHLDLDDLLLVAARERAGRILVELARQALKVDPQHPAWSRIASELAGERPLPDALIHWTRLAEPVMAPGKAGAQGWRLVA
jgi:hypothetical protein